MFVEDESLPGGKALASYLLSGPKGRLWALKKTRRRRDVTESKSVNTPSSKIFTSPEYLSFPRSSISPARTQRPAPRGRRHRPPRRRRRSPSLPSRSRLRSGPRIPLHRRGPGRRGAVLFPTWSRWSHGEPPKSLRWASIDENSPRVQERAKRGWGALGYVGFWIPGAQKQAVRRRRPGE